MRQSAAQTSVQDTPWSTVPAQPHAHSHNILIVISAIAQCVCRYLKATAQWSAPTFISTKYKDQLKVLAAYVQANMESSALNVWIKLAWLAILEWFSIAIILDAEILLVLLITARFVDYQDSASPVWQVSSIITHQWNARQRTAVLMDVILVLVLPAQHVWKDILNKVIIIASQYADPIATSVVRQATVRAAKFTTVSTSQQKHANSTAA